MIYKHFMVDCGLKNINRYQMNSGNDKFNPEIKSGNICLLSEDIIFWKLKNLNLQNDYIHFHAIDQNFMVKIK